MILLKFCTKLLGGTVINSKLLKDYSSPPLAQTFLDWDLHRRRVNLLTSLVCMTMKDSFSSIYLSYKYLPCSFCGSAIFLLRGRLFSQKKIVFFNVIHPVDLGWEH